jgi:hypothetical protein
VTRPPPMPHQAPSRAGQFQAPGGAPLAATQYGDMGDALNADGQMAGSMCCRNGPRLPILIYCGAVARCELFVLGLFDCRQRCLWVEFSA